MSWRDWCKRPTTQRCRSETYCIVRRWKNTTTWSGSVCSLRSSETVCSRVVCSLPWIGLKLTRSFIVFVMSIIGNSKRHRNTYEYKNRMIMNTISGLSQSNKTNYSVSDQFLLVYSRNNLYLLKDLSNLWTNSQSLCRKGFYFQANEIPKAIWSYDHWARRE